MTWERLALIHAAEDAKTLQKMARVFDYESESQQAFPKQPDYQEMHIAVESTSVSPDSAPRPSAKFLRLNKLEQLANSDNSDSKQPNYLYDSSLRLTAESAPKGTYRFAPPRSLFAMPRLLPFLHNSLGQPRAVGRVDFSRLTRLLANAKPVQRLPSLLRRRWPQHLQIVVDTRSSLEPYRTDFARIVAYFKKLLGAEAITAIRFSEDTLGKANADVIAWPTQSRDTWFTWRVPATDVAILILSDLGVGESHPETRIRWQQFLRHLQAHPAPILTLSPANQSPQSLLQCRQAKPSPLNDTSRLPRHPSRRGFRLPKFDSEKIEEILALLSPLPLIDAGLLRRLRDALQWGSSELEGQIWNHPDIQQTSLGIRLHDSVIEKYHQRYQQKFANTLEAAQLWQIVQAHHAEAFEGLRQLEALNRGVLEGNDPINTVRSYFQKLNATVMQETDPTKKMALLMQCRTILDSLPDSVWQSNMDDLAYELYAVSHQDDIRAGRWPEKLKSGFDPTRLQWVLDEHQKNERIQWQVKQIGPQGEFICQQQTKNSDLTPPIALLDAHPAFPPTYSFTSHTDDKQTVLHSNQVPTLSRVAITIQTTLQRLELDAIGKPDWATDIWCNTNGLFVKLPPWRGVEHTAIWNPGTADYAGRWLIPDPLNVDQYGLYADLEIPYYWTLRSPFGNDKDIVIQRFRWITPGIFQMGSPESESERKDNEIQHKVTLTQGFWLADSACTQDFWAAVMEGKNLSHFGGDMNLPVEMVSWLDAQQFITQLKSMYSDLSARLPTEAEWEYACRAGTTTPFSFGRNITTEQVNYYGEYPYTGGKIGQYRQKTVPVKSLPPNPWGLYEMHGNVWEWCADWYGEYPKQAVINPIGPDEGAARVLRGGSWDFSAEGARSTSRRRNVPDYRNDDIGFRLALG